MDLYARVSSRDQKSDLDQVEDDLVRDLVEILTSFCARLYGWRSADSHARKALEATAGDD